MKDTQMSQEIIQETFSVKSPAMLKVDNIRGSIVVKQGEEDQIQIKAIKHLDCTYPENTSIEISQAKDGSVAAITRFHQMSHLNLSRPCKIEYEILTPKNTSMSVDTVSGWAHIDGVDGNQNITSVSGALELTNLSGEFVITSVSGKIEGINISGSAKLKTVSGRIRIEESSLSSFTVTAKSGNIIIHSDISDGPYRISTVSGACKLIVPDKTSCSVSARSVSGHFVTNLSPSSQSINRRSWEVNFGGGGEEIIMKSVSGNFSVLNFEDANGRILSTREKLRNQRLDVLRKLEDGNLSVEETLAQLN